MPQLMSYEAFLDEVTTLMTEKYDMSDEDAIKHVMRAQANDFFTLHDDDPSLRTQERAEQDAQTIFAMKNRSRAHVAPKRTSARPQVSKGAGETAARGGKRAEPGTGKPGGKRGNQGGGNQGGGNQGGNNQGGSGA
jgi:hypothetical protein